VCDIRGMLSCTFPYRVLTVRLPLRSGEVCNLLFFNCDKFIAHCSEKFCDYGTSITKILHNKNTDLWTVHTIGSAAGTYTFDNLILSSGTQLQPTVCESFATTDATSVVLSTGSAFGNHYTTEQMLAALLEKQAEAGNSEFDADFATRVFRACGYEGHSVMLELPDVFRRFSRSEYLQHRSINLVGLAERAGEAALKSWGGPRSAITHLFWGTMTGGMQSPTIDIELTKRLGLQSSVERTSIEGMGCLTGFRLLNLARQVAESDKEARILVIAADLRSALGNSLPSKPTAKDIVSVALFRDAASSAIVGSGAALLPGESPCYEMLAGASRIVEESTHLVDYKENDDGSIGLHLSRDLPVAIGKHEPSFVAGLLEKGREALQKRSPFSALPPVTEMDILCHTGGPRVLREVAQGLGVTDSALACSWEVMKAHGNLSGASNLAVLDVHNSRDEAQRSTSGEWAVCLSMGPGVCLEGVLLCDVRKKVRRAANSAGYQ